MMTTTQDIPHPFKANLSLQRIPSRHRLLKTLFAYNRKHGYKISRQDGGYNSVPTSGTLAWLETRMLKVSGTGSHAMVAILFNT